MQRIQYRINPRRNSPRHILIKLTQTKHKENIENSKGKIRNNIQGKPHMFNSWSSAEILQGRREWQNIVKVLKGRNLQPRLLYQARISFKIDGDIKSFSDKQKLREFSSTKPALQQMLNGLTDSRNTEGEKSTKWISNN